MKFELQLLSLKTRFDLFVIVALFISLDIYVKPSRKIDTMLLSMSFDWDLDLRFFRLTLRLGSKGWNSSMFLKRLGWALLDTK